MPFDGMLAGRVGCRSVYDRVADLLQRDGWCQKVPRRYGQRCLIAAFTWVEWHCELEELSQDQFDGAELRSFAWGLGFPYFQAAVAWNDAPSTGFGDVMRRLREAAARERQVADAAR